MIIIVVCQKHIFEMRKKLVRRTLKIKNINDLNFFFFCHQFIDKTQKKFTSTP
jgi:hypothetical protein